VRAVIGAEILGMLLRGNTAGAEDVRRCLGRIPRAVEQFVSGAERSALALRARLDWLLPVLRMSIALVWILSGVVSLGLYPVSDSLGFLERVGLTGAAALTALYGGALLDIALGAAVYLVKCRRWRRWMWRLQIAVMLGYTALITLFLPELWLHPFGPLLKNVPMLAATLLLHEMEGTG
jgi:uncharacterized membrane protein YphA (DoxX/SURF4 family)